MSTVFGTAKARAAAATQPAPARRPEPKLRIVYGAPFRPPRMPFVLFVVGLLAAGLVGLLLLNTELQRGTFQVTALNHQADQLRDQQEQLERQARALESPQNLADRALRMGMVPNPNPVFLRLSDGKVLGVPAEGRAGTGTAMFGPDTPAAGRPAPGVPPAATPPLNGQQTGTPSGAPTGAPTGGPTSAPTGAPTGAPGGRPSTTTTAQPSTTITPGVPPATQPARPGSTTSKPTSTPSKPVPPTPGARIGTPTGG
jgi:cell division protein FtsB